MVVEVVNLTLTTQRKVYIAVLGLAGTALAADRLFLGGGPAPASAASPESLLIVPERAEGARTGAATAPNARAARGGPEVQVESVADRLRMFSEPSTGSTALADAEVFAIPASWGDPFGKAAAKPDVKAAFEAGKYRLTGVMKNNSDGTLIAVINRKAYRVDDEIDGMRLLKVGADVVVLEGPEGKPVELQIQRGLKSEEGPAAARTPAREASAGDPPER